MSAGCDGHFVLFLAPHFVGRAERRAERHAEDLAGAEDQLLPIDQDVNRAGVDLEALLLIEVVVPGRTRGADLV